MTLKIILARSTKYLPPIAITSSPAALPMNSLPERYEYAGSAEANDPGKGTVVVLDLLIWITVLDI